MSADFNPYQAPDAPVVEDFIAVEPRRRPTSNFVAAATCFGGAAFQLSIVIFFCYLEFSLPARPLANQPFKTVIILLPVTCSTLAFLLAGRAFWRMRDRLGVILFLTAVGAFVSIFLGPLLFP